ncbi:MAG: hypothetical protein LBQ09_10005 [Acidobacteriaceae bacterium]|jgi:YHS domain-containing protein|nr:hypothetical protein [Acidobacteriaceae bacterium]
MARAIFYSIVLTLVLRALAKFWRGLQEGLEGRPRQVPTPRHGVQMMRDPVCGTFVVPSNALSITAGGTRHYFCSAKCRAEFFGRQSGSFGATHGRTA